MASLQILKVEIGGDMCSTEGSELSHMHTEDDLNCERAWGKSTGMPGHSAGLHDAVERVPRVPADVRPADNVARYRWL